jgi:hypothetical protein
MPPLFGKFVTDDLQQRRDSVSIPDESLLAKLRLIIEIAGEGKDIEFKGWIKSDSPEGRAKIVRGCIALRNAGGGFFIIGLADDGDPAAEVIAEGMSVTPKPTDIRSTYSEDDLQSLVSDFAHEPFPIQVFYLPPDLHECVVIQIPGDLQTVVSTRRELKGLDGKILVRANAVYYRTLRSNGTYSTSEANYKDFAEIQNECWKNREWDIAQFVRRHWVDLRTHVEGADTVAPSQADPAEKLSTFVAEWLGVSSDRIRSRGVPDLPGSFTAAFSWGDVNTEEMPTRQFYESANAANPRYRGWPMWPNPPYSGTEEGPRTINNVWERVIVKIVEARDARRYGRMDYLVFSPNGLFLDRQAYEDDLLWPYKRPEDWKPGTTLEAVDCLLSVAETVLCAQAMTKALKPENPPNDLYFKFIWHDLHGRRLGNWARRHVSFPWETIPCEDLDHHETFSLPLETSPESLGDVVHRVTKRLFIRFGGFEMEKSAVNDWVGKLVRRQL